MPLIGPHKQSRLCVNAKSNDEFSTGVWIIWHTDWSQFIADKDFWVMDI